MSTDETILTLGGISIPIGAGRGISQSLNPISNGDLRRTVNGDLKDLTREQNRKFESSINCTDMRIPAISNFWKGQIITGLECVQHLNQNLSVASLSATLIRDPVVGSVYGYDAAGIKYEPLTLIGRDVTFSAAVVMIEFRPILDMMVVDYSTSIDEYASEDNWSLDLEEV